MWPYRHRISCLRMRLFRPSYQNMKECLKTGDYLSLFLLTLVSSFIFDFLYRFSLKFFSSSSKPDHTMVSECSVSLPRHFYLASHCSTDKCKHIIRSSFSHFMALLESNFAGWTLFFRSHSQTRISLIVHVSTPHIRTGCTTEYRFILDCGKSI